MDCKTADEYINLYIDDMLGKEETEQLLSHIESCSKCSRELQYAFELKKAMSGMIELDPPEGLAQTAIKKARRSRIPVLAYISAGFAAVVVAAVLLSSSFLGIDNNKTAASIAENDTADRKMIMAPAAGSAASSAHASASAAASSEPNIEYSAAMPEASMAPGASGPHDNDQQTLTGTLKQEAAASLKYAYTVPSEISDTFGKALDIFFEESGIQSVSTTDENGNNVVTFTISDEDLKALVKLIKKAQIPHKDIGEPIAGSSVEFTFEQ